MNLQLGMDITKWDLFLIYAKEQWALCLKCILGAPIWNFKSHLLFSELLD